MTTYVAFLRAINVGGRRVAMAELAAHFEAYGVQDVQTYIASGNVSFTSDEAADHLEESLAAHLERALGYVVPTVVRTVEELVALCESGVFAAEAARADTRLYVSFAKDLDASCDDGLAALSTGVDEFARVERDIFWLRHLDAGESMNNSDVEKSLGIVATLRNMNTVRKIVAKLGGG